MNMRLKEGKKKVITLSYDDGVVQDIRLIEIMNKYGLKGTFNINTGMYEDEKTKRENFFGRLKLSEAKKLYIDSGHEIALHSFLHSFLDKKKSSEIIYEIMKDRENIEREFGVLARGMAYPFGGYNQQVIDVLEKCNIKYARTNQSTYAFCFPDNWLMLHPTCRHKDENLMTLIENFIEKQIRWGRVEMFFLFGHSYEFDNDNNWEVIEEFAKYAGNRNDIWYATNIEIYDYVKAYESLEVSYNQKIIYNPSAIYVWIEQDEEVYLIKSGQTIYL